jgi:hypothetical protein
MTDSIANFFSGSGGGAYAKFPNVGDTIVGTIVTVHPPEPQTDFETQAPIEGKFQVRIDLQTELRDPDMDNDDGMRTVYVKGWMTGAIADALHAANAKDPQPGAKLTITRTGNAPPRRPGIQGAYQYSAVYEPAGSFFASGPQTVTAANGAAGPQNAPIPADPPAGIDAKAWEGMPHDVRQAIANAAAGVPSF